MNDIMQIKLLVQIYDTCIMRIKLLVNTCINTHTLYIYLIHTTLMLSTVLQAQCTCTCIHCTGIWFCDQWYNELIALWLRN